MSSQIDATKPTTGTATTQSVRDNFSNAVTEITALQGESTILSIAASVAANALTLALKTDAGVDATSTTGIDVTFRNATATTGTRTKVSATAALSVVVPQGGTLGFANSATDFIYVYALNNAGTMELAVSAKTFDQNSLQSTTAISANADSGTVMYSTVARSNVGVRLLGRVKIQTGATAGDWSNAPSEVSTTPSHIPFDEYYSKSDADATFGALDVANTYTKGQRGEVTTLTDGATITPDLNDSNNFVVTLGGNRTMANPSNATAGQSGSIKIAQDGTGSRTLAFGANWKFVGGTAPTLTTTASAIDRLDYYVASSTEIHAVVSLDVK